ncbi:MAG: diaminopropionate ammonia-lyase [Paracoccaceae bacterium]
MKLAEEEWQCSMVVNKLARKTNLWTAKQNSLLSERGLKDAKKIICNWPEFGRSPLISLDDFSRALNVSDVFYKDEGSRFGINTFKVLGGAYAVFKYLDASASDMNELAAKTTFVSATDGNHGRSVAWGTQKAGSNCVIVLPSDVSDGRRNSLIALGAKVITNPGTFDDCVRQAAALANENAWIEVSDTAYEGGGAIPADVMQGYEVATEEAAEQLTLPPTHVFIQAGVGGFAASVTAFLKRKFGPNRPTIILVEPSSASCCYDSIERNTPTKSQGSLSTLMGGLACGEVSSFAWEILKEHADAAVKISDVNVVKTMKLLAQPNQCRRKIVAGESAVAGLIGAMSTASNTGLRDVLKIGEDSRILVYGTEADTDPQLYKKLIDG